MRFFPTRAAPKKPARQHDETCFNGIMSSQEKQQNLEKAFLDFQKELQEIERRMKEKMRKLMEEADKRKAENLLKDFEQK